MVSANCSICYSNELVKKNDLFDDRYGYIGIFPLMQCKKCGHIFLDSTFTVEQLTDLYTNYYPRASLTLESYTPSPEVKGINAWLNGERRSAYTWIPKNVNVLDIGCGFGETLGYHKSRGCNVFGVEADENIQRVADRYGFDVHCGLFDPNIYESNFFDYVTMDQVIEHVSNPIETLKGISGILKKDGKLILSFPNANGWGAKLFGKRWINWHTPYHLNFFSKKSLSIAAKEAGLKILKIRTISSSEWLYYQIIHIFLFPKVGEQSSFWKPNKSVSFSRKLFIKTISLIHQTKINHLITRLFDALSIGDNYLIFLVKENE